MVSYAHVVQDVDFDRRVSRASVGSRIRDRRLPLQARRRSVGGTRARRETHSRRGLRASRPRPGRPQDWNERPPSAARSAHICTNARPARRRERRPGRDLRPGPGDVCQPVVVDAALARYDAAAVLDGGFAKWLAEGRPTVAARSIARRAVAAPRPDSRRRESRVVIDQDRRDDRWGGARRSTAATEPIDRKGTSPAPRIISFNNPRQRGLSVRPDLRERMERSIGTCRSTASSATADRRDRVSNLLAFEHPVSPARSSIRIVERVSADLARPVERG